MYYVYVIRDKITGKLYKGFSSDLKNRMWNHESRKVKTTKNWNIELIYYEAFKFEKQARAEENFLKSGKGRERLKYLLQE